MLTYNESNLIICEEFLHSHLSWCRTEGFPILMICSESLGSRLRHLLKVTKRKVWSPLLLPTSFMQAFQSANSFQ